LVFHFNQLGIHAFSSFTCVIGFSKVFAIGSFVSVLHNISGTGV
jgi:hypothetical protein